MKVKPHSAEYYYVVCTVVPGVTGDIRMDSDGDREPKYWLYRFNATAQVFSPFLHVDLAASADTVRSSSHNEILSFLAVSIQRVVIVEDPLWGTEDGKAPPAIPFCGFQNENCPEDQSGISS
jgi:atrial natriuretic peptide receptor A